MAAPLLHPLRIGDVQVPNNLVLSPMAGFSDLPFRVLCRRHGAGLVCSEMVASVAVERDAERAFRLMRTSPEERPTSVQLVGNDPDEVAHAARVAEDHCEILGFNMGCPAYQIQRTGCGAALLDRPDHAAHLVRAIKAASRRPLLVKVRVGNAAVLDVAAFARRLEDAGADGLIVHARTAAQGYRGRADWGLVAQAKAAVSIPVIGNGDVVDGTSAAAALRASGADGVAVGRAALGDPRVFGRIAHHLETGGIAPAPSPKERAADLAEYLRMAPHADIPHQQALEQAQRFARGLPGASRLRAGFKGTRALDDVRREFEAFVA